MSTTPFFAFLVFCTCRKIEREIYWRDEEEEEEDEEEEGGRGADERKMKTLG